MMISLKLGRGLAALAAASALSLATSVSAQQDAFDKATQRFTRQLEEARAELDKLRKEMGPEQAQLTTEMAKLEAELRKARGDFVEATRRETKSGIESASATTDVKNAEARATFLRGNLDEFRRKLGTRLHISEIERYASVLKSARLATENASATESDVYTAQLEVLNRAIKRIDDGIGGVLFEGSAVDSTGVVGKGTFALIGPAALFRSTTGEVGVAEERRNVNEPALAMFPDPELTSAATEFFQRQGAGTFPLDPTLGDATKIAETEEGWLDTVKKGGNVMIPIGIMAALALLVALWKWISLSLVRRPSRKRVLALLDAVADRDEEGAIAKARGIQGPTGKMLRAGTENLRQPRELIEEVMYEVVLRTRLKLQSMLPFIAICAAAAPLLGLLGTVTGIIQTFKLLTLFGAGDVKSLSGGISEALITTQYGLIVAIPSLLLHAYLSRKAKHVIGDMETNAIEFVNQASKTPLVPDAQRSAAASDDEIRVQSAPDPVLVREQVRAILGEMLGPMGGNLGRETGNGGGDFQLQRQSN